VYRVFLLLVSVLMKLLLQAGARGKSVSLANLQNILSSDQSGTSLKTSRSIRIHNFKVGSTCIRFSILITKATAVILTFRYSTKCTEAACLNIRSRQRLRISHSSSHVPSIKLFCVSLSLSLSPLHPVTRLCLAHLAVLHFKQNAGKSNVKKNI